MLNVECLYFTNSTYPRLETPVFRHFITQVFKKRPRAAQRSEPVPSKREPDYWRGRLFKNTFTYKGRRMEVSGWAVKIQLNGRRKTFSLSSSDQTQAAAEACQIYQDIVTKGWRAVGQRRASLWSRCPDKSGTPLPLPGSGRWNSAKKFCAGHLAGF